MEDEDDDDAEFLKTKKALLKFKEGDIDDDDIDDDDDEDYEYAGGDMNLYDSKLDEIDELAYMKNTMNQLLQNQQLAQQIIGQRDITQLMQTLERVEQLKAREMKCVDDCDALEANK